MTLSRQTQGPSSQNPAGLYAPPAGAVFRALVVAVDPATAWTTPNGYLVIPSAIMARTGVIDFGRGEKTHFSAEALLSPEALRIWGAQIVTDDHPEMGMVAVTSANARYYAVGFTQNAKEISAKADTGEELPHLAADLVITEQYTIDNVRAGKRQLSIGAFVFRDVAAEGKPYDWEVSSVEPNHVALVDRGACGSSCKVALHAAHDIRTTQQRAEYYAALHNSRRRAFMPLALFAPEQAQGETMSCKCAEKHGEEIAGLTAKLSALEAAKVAAEKAAEENRAKAETAAAQLTALQAGEAQRVEARIALLSQAREICGADYKPAAGASDLSIRADMVAAALPSIADSVRKAAAENNAHYVAAAFDAAMASRSAAPPASGESTAAAVDSAAAKRVNASANGTIANLGELETLRLGVIAEQARIGK